MKKDLGTRLKRIKLLIMDVDGVLTDGRIIVDDKGAEIKRFDVQDGFGIVLFSAHRRAPFYGRAGFKTAIISARNSRAVDARAKDLKIDFVFQDANPKSLAYMQIIKELGISDKEVCFIGDDLTDLRILKKVGFAVAVSNAVKEVKGAAHYVTKKAGGGGAVREVIELILKAQGKWKEIIQQYS